MKEWKKVKLGDVAFYVTEKVDLYSFNRYHYVSTESMLKDRCGITLPESIPTEGSVSKYESKDVLVSNIRPYFKKIWLADRTGGCSNDVLVFRNNPQIDPIFLYYVLSQDDFFDHMMAGANGTKMPRGNKKLILQFEIQLPPLPTQHRIATILSRYDSLIENYQKQIKLLEESAQRLYKEWFIDLRFPGHENTKIVDGVPEGWEKKKIKEIALLKAGGDKPEIVSENRTDICNIPIYSNGTSNEGLYGYTNKPEITEHCVTISARGSVGYTVMRRHPFVPIVRLISVIPQNIYVGYLYFYIKQMPLDSNGAAQQQITIPMIRDKETIIPTNLILNKLEKCLEPMFKHIDDLQSQIHLLTEARDRLLPKLMSGEIEV